MPTATKPKAAAKHPADDFTIDDEIAREMDRRCVRIAAFEKMKIRLAKEIDDLETPMLYMNPRQITLFEEFGLKSNLEIGRALSSQRAIEEARLEVGDPAKIEAAKVELAAAIDAEQSARADAADLDGDTLGEPVLAKQIRSLQQRLKTLTDARVAAQMKVERLVSRRQWLRSAAIPFLRNDASRELSRAKRSSGPWLKLEAVREKIRSMRQVVNRRAELSRSDYRKDPALCVWAQHHLPEAWNHGGGSPSINAKLFDLHIKQLQEETLPALYAEQTRLEAKWKIITDGIEAQLDHWMLTGEIY
jgi:hypothetical protein